VVPNIYGFSVWNLLHVSLLVPGIFKVAYRFLEDMCPASGFPFVMHLLYTLYYIIYDVMFRVGQWSSVCQFHGTLAVT